MRKYHLRDIVHSHRQCLYDRKRKCIAGGQNLERYRLYRSHTADVFHRKLYYWGTLVESHNQLVKSAGSYWELPDWLIWSDIGQPKQGYWMSAFLEYSFDPALVIAWKFWFSSSRYLTVNSASSVIPSSTPLHRRPNCWLPCTTLLVRVKNQKWFGRFGKDVA